MKNLYGKIFIFSSRKQNLNVVLSSGYYGADARRPDQRAILGVKPGDLAFLYDMDRRFLLGPFISEKTVYSKRSLWLDKDWPFRVKLRPWSSRIGILYAKQVLDMYRKIKDDLQTLRDIDDLHNRFLHVLLWRESVAFLKAFISMAEFRDYNEIIVKLTGRENSKLSGDVQNNQLNERPLNEYLCEEYREHRVRGKVPPEYILEGLLMYSPEALSSIAGHGFNYTYNMVFTYQNRFLDIMAVHLLANEVLKVTILELKKTLRTEKDMDDALSKLTYYMYTMSDKLRISQDVIEGHVVTWKSDTLFRDTLKKKFSRLRENYSRTYGVREDRIFLDVVGVSANGESMCRLSVKPIDF